MTVLRVYLPSECDERMDPLDWKRCRKCLDGRLVHIEPVPLDGRSAVGLKPGVHDRGPCPTCDGHGSLEAAALAHCMERHRDR